MNRSEYKNLQALADDLALLIELKKANERKQRERTGAQSGSSIGLHTTGQSGTPRHQQSRLLTGY